MTIDGNEIARSIGRLEGKVDTLIDNFTTHLVRVEERVGTVEKRVSSVERRTWWATGAAAVLAFVAGKTGISYLLPPH